MKFGVTIRGERQLFEAINGLIEAVSDQRERGWQPNVDVRLDYQQRHMDSEGSGDWPELSAGYAADKEAAVGNLPVLQYSTRMYRSLTEEGADNYVREESAESLKVGSSDPKAGYHHYGAGRLPVREVIRVTDEEAKGHLQVFHDGYEAISEALGFRVI
jgi:hypothetical protein